MKNNLFLIVTFLLLFSCGGEKELTQAERNLLRSMELLDETISNHFTIEDMEMARYYNPYTDEISEETGSIWMYTSGIEAVNNILEALKLHKETAGDELYNKYYEKYESLLYSLYENADYYLGTFELTSYTGTNKWTVYGVHRSSEKGKAKVEGIENVYDDQMWYIRELLRSYRITEDNDFLELAEYLAEYVLDGWDCTIDESGNERGGIPWGPGYVTKHSCSNGPLISPLVWLHEIYKNENDIITYRFIDREDRVSRLENEMKKSDYYLMFAKKVYDWQKEHLLLENGVYDDMMGGCTPRRPEIEVIYGVEYRKGITCTDVVGPAISYNSGTMLSGAADLYRATGEEVYRDDARALSDASFSYFANKDAEIPGYYSYSVNGFNNWFNGVLMRGYVDCHQFYPKVGDYINTFQQNLDYAYDNHLYEGNLPTNLLMGWESDPENNDIEAMFSFSFAAEYALIAKLLQIIR